jgi:uncharacterized protein
LNLEQFEYAERRFLYDYQNYLTKYQVDNSILDRAVHLAKRHGLRGYDAVQLATAAFANNERTQYGLLQLTFVCADNDLNEAAKLEGLLFENPNCYP